jgi:hypothetical protein
VVGPFLTLLLSYTARDLRKIRKAQIYLCLFDTKSPYKIVLNHKTSTDNKAIIDFRKAKTNLHANIYNWRISYPNEIIYLSLANITACFCFPRLSADISGAFGFLVKELYFTSTSHVFGSNTLASSCKPLHRAIQSMITVYSQRDNLIIKHKLLLEELQWIETSIAKPKLTKAFPCNINNGVTDGDGNILPMVAKIYNDHSHTCRRRLSR